MMPIHQIILKEAMYTKKEYDKAVQDEREACASTCEDMLFEQWTEADKQVLCAEAIRKRGSK